MSRAKTFLLVLGIAVIGGCASYGRNIQSAFEQEEIKTEVLQDRLKWLEPVVAEGKTHEQFRVVKSLRYVAKYNPDLEKRKLAVRGLLFISAFGDDRDVRSSAQSRLIALLNNSSEAFDLRSEIVDGKKDIVLGRVTYEEKEPSLFSSQVESQFLYPSEDDREAALLFLIDHFQNLEPAMQQHMVAAFQQILSNQPVCLEPSDEGCEVYDGETQDEWKKKLGSQINYWALNTCDWDKGSVSQEVKNSLSNLMTDHPDLISGDVPVCSPYHPASEDYAVLEMNSIRTPDNYFQFGLDLTGIPSGGLQASNLEFGFGNGRTFGVIFGMNIDERWMQPLREKYFTVRYRASNHKSAIGATRVQRVTDFSLVEQGPDDADGSIDGESLYINSTDENEVYFTSAFGLDRISTHLHLYLGSISQKIAFQYFFQEPDISFILEGSNRSQMKVEDRETDTIANQDKNERVSQASDLRNDILLGAKWNNISLLRNIFIGKSSSVARQGIFNLK
ncbi:MAG: hypothetical protein HQ517_17200, partial [SAR324 cluster bacterium]|nr:hypothetical protein [SAR324 cluster bacterium]